MAEFAGNESTISPGCKALGILTPVRELADGNLNLVPVKIVPFVGSTPGPSDPVLALALA